MATKKKKKKFGIRFHVIGHWIFLIGFVFAIPFGALFPNNLTIATILVLLSLAVGVLNTRTLEFHNFQTATTVLLLAAWSFKLIPVLGGYFMNIIDYLIIFVSPAAVLAALTYIYNVATRD